MARILGLLRAHPAGLTTQDLLDRVGYRTEDRASSRRALNRDLAALKADGWRIQTGETANTSARRVLRTVDNRFATLFTAEQRRELARSAACAGPGIADVLAEDLGRWPEPPVFEATGLDGVRRLAVCQTAMADRCALTFTYNGKLRLVHPVGVVLRQRGWYLRAVDTGDGKTKTFSIDRISGIDMDPPGTNPTFADPPQDAPEWNLLRQREHEPITVTVDTMPEFLPDVMSSLAVWGYTLEESPDPDQVRVVMPVTAIDVLLGRLLDLGTRVRLVGPEPVRDSLRTRLLAAGGGA